MRVHTSDFKQEISQIGKQISGRLYHYLNYDLITEDGDTIITEDNIKLISEQSNPSEKELIDEELIYSIDIVRNGQLLQSLMKEVDFEAKIDLRIGDMINAQFGLLVNNDYEYLDYGNYIVYSKEYIAENQTWQYVCYDKMLYSMIPYKPLNVAYPCTIREYIAALADSVGLEFANVNDEFVNYDQQVLKDLYVGQDKTYRDVLDKLSVITASNILINDNDELELGYINDTDDTIDESHLKDVNINFGETFGPINKISIIQDGIEYLSENTQSIEANGMTQINIDGNPFIANGFGNAMVDNILEKLNNITYSINNFASTGICYYDYLDLFNVSANNNIYKCLLLNDEINISSGLQEQIFTEEMKSIDTTKNNYKKSTVNSIESRVEKDGVISAINQSAEEIQIQANKIKLEGYTTINDGFSVDLEGNMTCNGANINNANIKNLNASSSDPIEIKTSNSSDYLGTSIYPALIELENTHLSGGTETVEPQIELSWDFLDATTTIGAGGCYSPSFTPTSRAEKKKNFEKFDKGLETLKKVDIYKYNLKMQEDGSKKHIGFVIGEDFKYATELTDEKEMGADLYSFVSVCCQAIKEQQEQIETLQKRIEDLERKNK